MSKIFIIFAPLIKNRTNMNKEELIQFLKENLKVSVYAGVNEVTVSLHLCGEEISSSSDELVIR